MKKRDLPMYAVGSLATVIFIALAVCVVRIEGERTRRQIREAAEGSERDLCKDTISVKQAIDTKTGNVRDAMAGPNEPLATLAKDQSLSPSAKEGPGAGATVQTQPETNLKGISPKPTGIDRHPADLPTAAKDTGPSTASPRRDDREPDATKKTVKPKSKTSEDFDLDDFNVFPGLSPSKSQPSRTGLPTRPDGSGEPSYTMPPADREAQPEKAGSALGPGTSVAGHVIRKEPKTAVEPQRKDGTRTANKPSDPTEVVSDLFKLGHDVSKQVDAIGQQMLGLSVEEERNVGREVHQMVRREHKILDSPRLTADLQRLARPILELRERKGITYSFFVVDDPIVDAFAHVGGYVYVSKGLVDYARNDVELQMVLGHEIAHIDLKHVTEQITYAARAAEKAGEAGFVLARLAYTAVATGYNEQYEFEADQWSYRNLLRIRRSREEALAFLRRFSDYAKKHGLESRPVKPASVFESASQEVRNHFNTHPPVQERLRRLEALRPAP